MLEAVRRHIDAKGLMATTALSTPLAIGAITVLPKDAAYAAPGRLAMTGVPSHVNPTLLNSGSLRGSASGSAGRFSQTLKCSIITRKTSVAAATIPRLTTISVHSGR